jgi:hypothetical protein
MANLQELRMISQSFSRDFFTLHHLPKVLVELDRAVDGDSARERELLDLFDNYLARGMGSIRTEIGAYERH